MHTNIKSPVGVRYKAKNNHNDVFIIQRLINKLISKRMLSLPLLAEDRIVGRKTVAAILIIQSKFVNMRYPDGVISPAGITLKTIVQKVKNKENNSKPNKTSVKYRRNAKKILSEYTICVLKSCMYMAGITTIDVSSTLRSISDQARIMYSDNVRAYNKGVTVNTFRGYRYGPAGTSVDQVFKENHPTLDEKSIRALMEDKIEEWLNKGVRTSKHCVTKNAYSKNNILDIPYSSIPLEKRALFEEALIIYSKSTNKRKYSSQDSSSQKLNEQPIEKLIIESRCWHIEIPQSPKVKLPTIND